MTETITSATKGALMIWGKTNLDTSNGSNADSSLADGEVVGQIKVIAMTGWASGGNTLVSVTSHETASPRTFGFGAVGDTLILQWSGSVWMNVAKYGLTES